MPKIETQTFEIIKIEKELEIRRYPPAKMATISMESKLYNELSSAGFRKLTSYIFGQKNHKNNIAMISPDYEKLSLVYDGLGKQI